MLLLTHWACMATWRLFPLFKALGVEKMPTVLSLNILGLNINKAHRALKVFLDTRSQVPNKLLHVV